MMRAAPQALLRASSRSVAPRSFRTQTTRSSRRYASTVPADKPRTWKSSALRWGLAGAVVYYYNTSNLFAEQPGFSHQTPPQAPQDDGTLETLESITSKRRERTTTHDAVASSAASTGIAGGGAAVAGGELSPEELEQEAGQEGAFNPETGEINWDCPCLGGMAHGPCGEEFKAAFSCFVFSKEDPKGIDCIENFKGMQDCFRQYPDIYGAELTSDDDDDDLGSEMEPASTEPKTPAVPSEQVEPAKDPSIADRAKRGTEKTISQVKNKANEVVDHTKSAVHETRASIEEKIPQLASRAQDAVKETQAAVADRIDRAETAIEARKRSLAAKKQVDRDHGEPRSESEQLVPKAWHDTTDDNSKAQQEK